MATLTRTVISGYLPDVRTTLYTAPAAANSTATIFLLHLSNIEPAQERRFTFWARTVEIHTNEIIEPSPSGIRHDPGPYVLKAGEILEGMSDVAAKVAYHIAIDESVP